MKTILKNAVLVVLAAGLLLLFGCGTKSEPVKQDTSAKTISVSEERKTDLEGTEQGAVEKEQGTVEEEPVDVSKEAILKELASLEKDWLSRLHNIIVESDSLLDQWLGGNIGYNQYIVESYKYKEEFDELYNEAETAYKEKDIANILKDEPLYKNKLVHGKQLRDTVKEFFDIVYEGKKGSSGKVVDTSREEYKDLYDDLMIKEYNKHYRLVLQAIK